MKNSSTDYFFTIIFLLIFVSAFLAFYRFVLLEDFAYFESEEQLPEVFNSDTYL